MILEQSLRAGVGHIGSALSIADVLYVLYFRVLRMASPEDPSRDFFILSKGHAALAQYAALHLKEWISSAELHSYCADNSHFGVHPERQVAGVEFSTGSLGQGLAMGAGAALAARLKGIDRRVFVLISDAECNEGAVWETAMFARHHQLSNLIVLIDENGQQAMGRTQDVVNLSPLAERWRSFGWDVSEEDAHNVESLTARLQSLETRSGAPHVVVCHAIFGKGVSFMEGKLEWHYLPMNDAQYAQALQEVQNSK